MNEKVFKYLAVILGIIVVWSFCSGPKDKGASYYDVNVQSITSASEGLDLKAVGELVKKAKDAESLERLLNSDKEGVNNLDLDEDGKVDYIKVTEYGNDQLRGFSLTVEPKAGEVQEVATIEVQKSTDKQAEMQIKGNEQIYGRGHYYHSRFGLTDFLILSYLFNAHTPWISPWGYGRYPGYYRPYSTMPSSRYRSTVNRTTGGSTFRSGRASTIRSSVKSPNAGKSATSVRAPLKNPTASQKAFQARNPSKQVRSGGFGRRSSRSSSLRRSPSSRSRSFSRGGK